MDNTITHIRPRFDFTQERTFEEYINRLTKILNESPDHISGRITDRHVTIEIVGNQSHFWSPHLDFRVESTENDPGQITISGLIGPSPGVWTLFVFIYFVIGLSGFIFFSIGVSNWIMNKDTTYFWSLPVTILLLATAYKAGKLGEQLGADQILELKKVLQKTLK